jgi:protein-S-isoprenylcysteine O-methyltransferase Ste14
MVSILLQMVIWTAFIAALLLWPAGTLAYPGALAFIAMFAVGGLVIVIWLAKYSPSLLRERLSSPIQRDQKPWDRVWLSFFVLAFCAWLAFMGWDAARTGFSAVPPWLQVFGGLAIAVYMVGSWLTFRENAFAAPVVKIQQGQRVIDTGPYAIVRHPLYASALLFLTGLPLLLGSWIGLALSSVFILGMGWRAVHEEQTLLAELQGYGDYVRRVRYRFVPYVW